MALKLDKILCTTDFSPYAEYILTYGVALARRFEAELLVFHAIYSPHSQPDGAGLVDDSSRQGDLFREARQHLRQIMADKDVPWDPIIALGEPAEEAARAAREHGVDLVVAASYGHSGWKRWLMGTVVERMVRFVAQPIMVLNPPTDSSTPAGRQPMDIQRILVGSEVPPNPATMAQAVFLAMEFGSEIHLLHALERPTDDYDSVPGAVSFVDVQKAHQAEMSENLFRMVPEEALKCCGLKTTLVEGVPGEQLSRYARDHRFDLIIVGSRPQGRLEKILNTSTTEMVLRDAPCPVLAVPDTSRAGREQGPDLG